MNSDVLVSEKELEFIRAFQLHIGRKVSVHAGMTRFAQRIANYFFSKSQRPEVRKKDKRRSMFGFASYYNEFIFRTKTQNKDIDDILTELSKKRDHATLFDNYIDSIGVTLVFLVSGEVIVVLLVAKIPSSEISTSILQYVKEIPSETINYINSSLFIQSVNEIRKQINLPPVVMDMELQTASYSLVMADKKTLESKMKDIGTYSMFKMNTKSKSAYETFITFFTKPQFVEMILAPAFSMAFGINHDNHNEITLLILAREEVKNSLNLQNTNNFTLQNFSTPQPEKNKNCIFSPIHSIDIPSTPKSIQKMKNMKATDIMTPRKIFNESINPIFSPMNTIRKQAVNQMYNPNEYEHTQTHNNFAFSEKIEIINCQGNANKSANTNILLSVSDLISYHSPVNTYSYKETQIDLISNEMNNLNINSKQQITKPEFYSPASHTSNVMNEKRANIPIAVQTKSNNIFIPNYTKPEKIESKQEIRKIFNPMEAIKPNDSHNRINIFNPMSSKVVVEHNQFNEEENEKINDIEDVSNTIDKEKTSKIVISKDNQTDTDTSEKKVHFNISTADVGAVQHHYLNDQIISIAEGEISFYIVEELNKMRNSRNCPLLLVDTDIQIKLNKFLQDFVAKRVKFDQNHPVFVEIKQKYKRFWIKTFSGNDFHIAPQNFLENFFSNSNTSFKLLSNLNRIIVSVNIQKNNTYNIICLLGNQ